MINLKISTIVIIIVCCTIAICETNNDRPNIIIIVADDLGWNDVSYHGSMEIPTPNIDSLCYNGVILNRMYTAPLCSPSRASLMTGKNSIKLGLQHFVIISDEPWGLPLNEKLISNYFQDAGYRTALIGKWHLGFYKRAHTPMYRGFSDFFGYLGPYIGYYDHSLIMLDRNYSRGYDMRRNVETENRTGIYATELFTNEAVNLIKTHDVNKPLFLMLTHLAPHTGNEDKPMEAPDNVVKKFGYIKEAKRRTLAAMVSVLDDGIGKVIKAVKDKGIMNNTIILFMSDNGAPTYGIHSTEGSNYPLRGQKANFWEGASRVPACLYSPLIKTNQRVTNELIHITDILPTMAAAANISITDESIDGINQWKTIADKEPTKRDEILYNIEPVLGYSAMMIDGWKVVNGSDNYKYSGWLGSSGNYMETTFDEYINILKNSPVYESLPGVETKTIEDLMKKSTLICNKNSPVTKCHPELSPCLYNVIDDPCEMNNLADSFPEKVQVLLTRLDEYRNIMVPSLRKLPDPNCDPKYFNYTWNWWIDDDASNDIIIPNRQIIIKIIFGIAGMLLILIACMCCLCYINKKHRKRGSLEIKNGNFKPMK